MVVKIRNVSGTDREMEGRIVERDEVIEVKGVLRKNPPADAILIGSGEDARLFSTEHWDLVDSDESEDAETAPKKD